MKNKIILPEFNESFLFQNEWPYTENAFQYINPTDYKKPYLIENHEPRKAGILFITSYPPRECGIATYSEDLIKALNNKFSNSLSLQVCALESGKSSYKYPEEVKYVLNTSKVPGYHKLAQQINKDNSIEVILVQHEFGFFKAQEQAFQMFLNKLSKPIVVVFHTVLPHPDMQLKTTIKRIADASTSIIVMTNTSSDILVSDYEVLTKKITVIAHGTHLVKHLKEKVLKAKYNLSGKKVLTTFGLLSSGKSLETTLEALPAIIKTSPDVIFLIIGKTHPEVVKSEGEQYRDMLTQKVIEYNLQNHVRFINTYLPLPELLEYLQLTDIYLFTTNDPNQAVSGTFAYAMSCGCPIISTPIPHAREVLTEDTGIIFDFRNAQQLAVSVKRLLDDEPLRRNIITNTLQKIVSTVWQNSAVAHARLFERIASDNLKLDYTIPPVNLDHLKLMTTKAGIIQFSKINQPDPDSGYTLDDNARALIAMCMYYKNTGDDTAVSGIYTYLAFLKRCQQPNGDFLNYVDKYNKFTLQNKAENLDDANGRAIWALGYLISLIDILPAELVSEAKTLIEKALSGIEKITSTRAMAFTIKGLYYYQSASMLPDRLLLIKTLADRLVQMYKHESDKEWEWFEGYMTYANSILPEALLYAWLLTGDKIYKSIALTSFDFLLLQTFNENGIEVISNRKWLQKGSKPGHFGEQPIDVAYTIMTLSRFYDVFADKNYYRKLETAYNWFLGKNRLHQIMYNPCTGGCYDGLEETHVNLNQGAESTVSYLMARLAIEKYQNPVKTVLKVMPENFRLKSKHIKNIYTISSIKST